MNSFEREVRSGHRFEFGRNWAKFLLRLDDSRISLAEDSLKSMLGVKSLNGARFLDAGSGSGLFSLAARRLGAEVHSFDYDPDSVKCTGELRQRYFPGDDHWTVQHGSVLDPDYLGRLGKFDVVYSWGVLHHTGSMWTAIGNVLPLVRDGGKLFIAIYNDQGGQSRRWLLLKRIYNALPRILRLPYALLTMGLREARFFVLSLLSGRISEYFRNIANYDQYSRRGMSYWHDLVDWIGGYPFEVAKPEDIFTYCRDRGFRLVEIRTCGGGLGCNEFVLEKERSVEAV